MAATRIEELLRHEGFVRRTLRGLLAREEDLQDVLQQTWLSVLERPAVAPERLRAWLARVARNVALSGIRSQGRRTRREVEAAAPSEERSPAESAARMEGLQRVVAAILALEEPYRSVVLLRYEQDLDRRAIAAQLGRSEATVRSQLARAHELLRRKLDREFGGRERWAVLALPVAVRVSPGLVPLAGLALALAGGASTLVWWSVRQPAARGSVLAPTLPSESVTVTAITPAELAAREPLPVPPSSEPSIREPAAAAKERLLPPAELLDRAYYDDYERGTFSFEHGVRDDPDRAITRNDWDVMFSRGIFKVRTVVDDGGLVFDLGARSPLELEGASLAGLAREERAPVLAGHSYFIWSLDCDTDLACLAFVRELDAGKRCLFDWYATDGSGRGQGSLSEDGAGERLVDLLVRLRAEIGTDGALTAPRVLLQARGHHETIVHMNGELSPLVELAPAPLVLDGEIAMIEPARAYFEGGWIPPGQVFHVTRVAYFGRALGDSNRSGFFAVSVGGKEIVRTETSSDPVQGVWSGDIALRTGVEYRTYLAIANSSGEARFGGFFAPAESGPFGRENAGFFRAIAPASPSPAPPVVPVLAAARAVLQARSGAGGGNPNRVDLRGRTSQYVDRVVERPLDFSWPLDMNDDSCVHVEGGRVPADQAFVVTRATWAGSSTGDSNGGGELKLVVAGEVLVDEENGTEPHLGAWNGRLVILPGEESRTYLEIANTSAGDVLLTGHFEPLSD